MKLFNFSRKQKGFTLIEAMIAVVVFSFGLLGVAGVMLVSVKSNHNGYMRSQATFLAHSMIDMMRKNSWSVWRNNYNGDFGIAHGDIYNDLSTTCDAGNGCNSNAVANRDTALWSNLISQTLPNGGGQIACVPTGPMGSAVTWNEVDRPYLGQCTVTVTWDESNQSNAVAPQQIQVLYTP